MKKLIIAIKMFILFTVLTGLAYPLFLTGIGQIFFSEKVNGSIIIRNNSPVGSKLIGQNFDSIIYFSSRPSAISYSPIPSGGSNYGLTNKLLVENVIKNKNHFLFFNGLDSLTTIPSEMLFSSASGLDPHISPLAAKLQVDRVAKARNFSENQKNEIIKLVGLLTEKPQFLCLGEERINVLMLNLKLDNIK
jgi:potassium-transporting ATPase KdpC subunit